MPDSFPDLPPSDQSNSIPGRWRVGRVIAICFFLGGILFAVAGHIAELPPLSTAGGEVFGGTAQLVSGITSLCLLLSMKRRSTPRRLEWSIFAILALGTGGSFLASGLEKVSHARAEKEASRIRRAAIKESLDLIRHALESEDVTRKSQSLPSREESDSEGSRR